MHKRILLCLNRDQSKTFDYSVDPDDAMLMLGGNSGNNVFQYTLQNLLRGEDCQVDIDTDFFADFSAFRARADAISAEYDAMVFSPANVFANYAVDAGLTFWRDNIEKLRIPVYAIGAGAQSDASFSLGFVDEIRDQATAFVRSILNTGGTLGLRGYFTESVVRALGFQDSDYTVIGCPSIFLRGRGLRMEKPKLAREELRVAVNGFRAWNDRAFHRHFREYPGSYFVCQEEFYRLLYAPDKLTWKELQYLSDPSELWLSMYRQDRIALYGDIPAWFEDLKRRKINFSFGCRIHGNILPILAGIPAYLDALDSRVRELGEFFSIPARTFDRNPEDLYELYEQTDYTAFNAGFAARYDNFAAFMSACGLPCSPASGEPPHGVVPRIKDDDKDIVELVAASVSCNPSVFRRDVDARDVVFVAHEFGLYKGHGGIASYLYNICKYLVENTNINVHVISPTVDEACDLLRFKNFAMHHISGNISEQRGKVFSICADIQPQYIEFAEYAALGMNCTMNKASGQDTFKNTLLVTNNHTASRECYEWSSGLPYEYASSSLMQNVAWEKIQMETSDVCIAPSKFLGKYVKKQYRLKDKVLFFMNPFMTKIKNKSELQKELAGKYDLYHYNDSFNITLVTRFEGRKNQKLLVKAFLSLMQASPENIRLFLAGGSTCNPHTGEDYREEVWRSLPEDLKDHVLLYDFLSQSQQEPFMAVTDLTVMPSVFENQPMAMIETAMREIPVIASRYSGCADYLLPEMLFDPFVEGSLAEVVGNFMRKSAEERAAIALIQKRRLSAIISPAVSILPRFSLAPRRTRRGLNLDLQELYHE
ncbi:glycosyltransferase family 4 protein [uncultured Mailhella sp.]|uniref:glycosyltransferase family 4 protein n=1 Tax=uncultured Mailhella sp. TaxID=1981031 RepID=UPI00320A7778